MNVSNFVQLVHCRPQSSTSPMFALISQEGGEFVTEPSPRARE